MLIEVRLWRFQGKRLPDAAVSNGKAYRGYLRMQAGIGSDRPVVAELLAAGPGRQLIPSLHEPIMTMVGNEGFVLRGIERLELQDGVYGVVQEWRCDVVIPRPSDDGKGFGTTSS